MPTNFIFDLDGTIADTSPILVQTYKKIASEHGLPLYTEADFVYKLRNNKPQDLLKEIGISKTQFLKISIKVRKTLYNQMSQVKPISGMKQVLIQLDQAGYNLGIMTSNSRQNTHQFLSSVNLLRLFPFIYTSHNIFGKDKVIKRLLKEQKINKNEAIYIGDETRDIEACKKVGIRMIATTWGLNSREMLQSLQPDKIVESPIELLEVLQSFS